MNNILGHIIGLDEIHKKKLIKQLPKNIRTIDLDYMQQIIYNDTDLVRQKMVWGQIGKDILFHRKQKKLVGSKRIITRDLDQKIKKLMVKRNTIRQKIHRIWRDKMTNGIENELAKNSKYHILFLGFNIFPKDYRVKIALPIQQMVPVQYGGAKYFNKIYYDTKPAIYAANQIKYYIKTYADKIINGTFNLNLLNTEYLSNKYQKFIEHYYKQGYTGIPQDDLAPIIKQLDGQLSSRDKIIDRDIYIATLYKSGDIIPVNVTTSMEGFLNKEDAIANIKSKMKRNGPIYLYKIKAEQFQMANGKLIATQALYPINEESLLLTI